MLMYSPVQLLCQIAREKQHSFVNYDLKPNTSPYTCPKFRHTSREFLRALQSSPGRHSKMYRQLTTKEEKEGRERKTEEKGEKLHARQR